MAEKKTEAKAENVSIFEQLSKVNVNDHLDTKKSGSKELSYLSWPWAVSEISKIDPEWEYKILEFDAAGMPVEHGLPYQTIAGGYMVHTEVTVLGKTKRMWLPVMDHRNNAVKDHQYQVQTQWGVNPVAPLDSNLINKTIMRCLVKNLAMFGLGLYIYAGEDLPENENETVLDGTAPMAQNIAEPAPVTVPATEPAVAQPDTVTVEAPALPDLGDVMSLQEAQIHILKGGGDKYKGHTVQYMIDTAKSAEHARLCLESFANKGAGLDKKACAVVLEAFDNGIIQYKKPTATEEAAA